MIEYEEDWAILLLFRWRGSVYSRAMWFAFPSAVLCLLLVLMDTPRPDIRVQTGIHELNEGIIWSATTTILLTLVAFRTREGYSRFWEGTGLLHQMKGEWFDTISNCVSFSTSAKAAKSHDVMTFRHTIVRLMSLCHASALEEISGLNVELETIDMWGLDVGTLRHLKSCVEDNGFNKVEVILHMIQTLITNAQENGVLNVPPPILSRVFQTCSRGYVNLLNSKKITDTKFPFPYVQLITLLLLLHTVFTPMIVSSLLGHVVLAPLVTFVSIFGTHSLNFISAELEDPFGDDDNDLPLGHFQAEMNRCLLMLLHYDTDIVARTSPDCITDFEQLKQTMELQPFRTVESSGIGLVARLQMSVLRASRKSPPRAPPGISRGSVRFSDVEGARSSDGPRRPSARFSHLDYDPQVVECGNGVHLQIPQVALQPVVSEASSNPHSAMQRSAEFDSEDYVEQHYTAAHVEEGCACVGRCACKVRQVHTSPIPKLVASRDQDCRSILEERFDEFSEALQTWTQQMEADVTNLVRHLRVLSRNGEAAPRPLVLACRELAALDEKPESVSC